MPDTPRNDDRYDIARMNAAGRDGLPGLVGLEVVRAAPDALEARLEVGPQLLAPNGFLHAASVIALADTACGFATLAGLPEGTSFTTLELKSNFVGTARDGAIRCVATPLHRGRTTQVWDAVVRNEADDRTIATFRCTQLVLQPRPESRA